MELTEANNSGEHNKMSTNSNLDLQQKIVEVLNEEIGSDLKHLSKLKELYEETRTVQENLKEKVCIDIIYLTL